MLSEQQAAQQKRDQALQTSQTQNVNKQAGDAQWMQMRTLANTMGGLNSQPPLALTSQNGSQTGAQAGAKAGKI